MPPRVVALYRYPVKGFTPEECETLTVLDEGRIAGDRVLGVRFADTEAADDAWSRKTGMVALIGVVRPVNNTGSSRRNSDRTGYPGALVAASEKIGASAEKIAGLTAISLLDTISQWLR